MPPASDARRVPAFGHGAMLNSGRTMLVGSAINGIAGWRVDETTAPYAAAMSCARREMRRLSSYPDESIKTERSPRDATCQ